MPNHLILQSWETSTSRQLEISIRTAQAHIHTQRFHKSLDDHNVAGSCFIKKGTQKHVAWEASNPLTSIRPAGKQSHQTCLLIWNKTIGSKHTDKPHQGQCTALRHAQHILKEILPLFQWWFRRERKPCWDFTLWIPKMVSDCGLIAQNVSPCRNSPSTMQKGSELDVPHSTTAENSIWRCRFGGIHLVPVFTLLSLSLRN